MVHEPHPAPPPSAAADPAAIALREIHAAIELVAGGAARRVAIVSLDGLEQVAAEGLAAARAAGVEFRLERTDRAGRDETAAPTLMVGPVRRG